MSDCKKWGSPIFFFSVVGRVRTQSGRLVDMAGRAGKVLCPIDVVGDMVPGKVQVPGVKITAFRNLFY